MNTIHLKYNKVTINHTLPPIFPFLTISSYQISLNLMTNMRPPIISEHNFFQQLTHAASLDSQSHTGNASFDKVNARR